MTFAVRCARLGELSRVRIAHDNAFAAASWHVASVEVREVRSGRCWAFPSDVWLSARQGDQGLARTLVVAEAWDEAPRPEPPPPRAVALPLVRDSGDGDGDGDDDDGGDGGDGGGGGGGGGGDGDALDPYTFAHAAEGAAGAAG